MPVTLNVVFSPDGPYLKKGGPEGTPNLDVDALAQFLKDSTATSGEVPVKDIKPAPPKKYVRFNKLAKEFLDHLTEISDYFASKCSEESNYKDMELYRESVDKQSVKFALLMRDSLTNLDDDVMKRLQADLRAIKAAVPNVKARVDELCPAQDPPLSATRRLINMATRMTDLAWAAFHMAYIAAQTVVDYLARVFMGTARYWYTYGTFQMVMNAYFTVAAAAVAAPDFVKETLGRIAWAWAWFIQWGYSIREHGITEGTAIHFEKTQEAFWDWLWWVITHFVVPGIGLAAFWYFLWKPRIQAGMDLFGQGGPRPRPGGGGTAGFSGLSAAVGVVRRGPSFKWMELNVPEQQYIQQHAANTLPVLYKPSADDIVAAVKAVEDPQPLPDPMLSMPSQWTQDAKELLCNKGLMASFLANVALAVMAAPAGGGGALAVHALKKGALAWLGGATTRLIQTAWLTQQSKSSLETITQNAAVATLGKLSEDPEVHLIFRAIFWSARAASAAMTDAAAIVVPMLLAPGAAPQAAVVPAGYLVSREVRELMEGNARWGVGGTVNQ